MSDTDESVEWAGKTVHPGRAYNPGPTYLRISLRLTAVSTGGGDTSCSRPVTLYYDDGRTATAFSMRDASVSFDISRDTLNALVHRGGFNHRVKTEYGIVVGAAQERK